MTPFCYHCLTREHVWMSLSQEEAQITFNLMGISLCAQHFSEAQARQEARKQEREDQRPSYLAELRKEHGEGR